MSDVALPGVRPSWVHARETGSAVSDPRPEYTTSQTLPTWPLTALFGFVPLWLVLGLFYALWPVAGALLLLILMTRGKVRWPAGSAFFIAFLGLAVVSATELDRASRLLSYSLRMSFYITGLVVGLYVYNLLRDGVPWERVLRPLCLFWIALIVLGWFGVLAPGFTMRTPIEYLLPGHLASQPFVIDMVRLTTTEFNPLSTTPTSRPSAPFPYTNTWGSTYAILVPCIMAYLASVRTGRLRLIVLISLPLSLPPAFLTLNRGLFLSLGVGFVVLGVRAIRQGNWRIMLSLLGVVLVGALFTIVIPVGRLIAARVESSNSTADRLSLYLASLHLAAQSPLFGIGTPESVDTTTAAAPVGTQGQLWVVLVSNGIPALICFMAWLVAAAARSWKAKSRPGQWLAIVPIIALTQMPFYGLTFQNLSLLFFAIALGVAPVDGPVRRVRSSLRASNADRAGPAPQTQTFRLHTAVP